MSSLLEQTIDRLATKDVCHTSTTNIFQRSFFNIFEGIKDAVFLFQNQSPSFQFDCVPPVVNVAHRKPLGHLSAMLGHELRHELRLNLRYNPLYTFFKRTRHQFLLLARDVIMSGQLTP